MYPVLPHPPSPVNKVPLGGGWLRGVQLALTGTVLMTGWWSLQGLVQVEYTTI